MFAHWKFFTHHLDIVITGFNPFIISGAEGVQVTV